MVSRRKFLGFMAVLPTLTVLAGSGLRLPRREDVEVATETRFSNIQSSGVDLSEKVLTDLLNQLRDNEVMSMYHVRPYKLIIPPNMAKLAERVLTHRPTFFERLWWHLTSAAA
jgi:hypothetical protein